MSAPHESDPDRDGFDPLVDPTPSPANARTWAVVSLLCAAGAIWIPAILGPVGMMVGAIANLKGDRLGMVGAVLSGVATVTGFALAFFIR